MPADRVELVRTIAAPAEAVWAVVRDFCGRWHPWVASVTAERDARGCLIRAFTVTGEATTYREQLTFVSDTDRTLAYTHLEGIEGCTSYTARMVVAAADGGCELRWTADVEAPAERLGPICQGTLAVYAAGADALATVASRPPHAIDAHGITGTAEVAPLVLDGEPRLALLATPATGDDRLCLFLHGIGGNAGNWQRQLPAAGSVMRAAALDLRGYGGSGLGPQQTTVDNYCADILRVADGLGAQRLVLCGLSYGSWLATSFAMRHPDRLAGLILSGGCTGMSEAGAQERDAFRTSREVPLNAGLTPRDFAPAVVKVLAGPNASDAVREQLFASMAAIPAATYRDALTCFTNPPERFDFSGLTMPVLMVTGEHDRLAPPAEIRGVASRIAAQASRASVRFEVISGAGHVCNVEQPDTYSRHLTEFLRGLPV